MKLYEDILSQVEYYRTVLTGSVLFISHKGCLDGISSIIIAEKYFKNFSCVSVGYDNIDEYLDNLDETKFDCIFMVDICPKDIRNLYKFKNYIVLDHHESVIKHYNPNENRLIYDHECGASLMKRFTEAIKRVRLSELDEYVANVNDYDMWYRKSKYGHFLQFLFYKIGEDKYKSEIKNLISLESLFEKYSGEYNSHKKSIEDVWHKLSIEDIECRFKVAHIHLNEHINDICHKVLEEENYDIVICHKNNNLHSIRVSNKVNFDSGRLLTELGIGGGHPKASAFMAKDIVEYTTKLKMIIDGIGPF